MYLAWAHFWAEHVGHNKDSVNLLKSLYKFFGCIRNRSCWEFKISSDNVLVLVPSNCPNDQLLGWRHLTPPPTTKKESNRDGYYALANYYNNYMIPKHGWKSTMFIHSSIHPSIPWLIMRLLPTSNNEHILTKRFLPYY